MQSVSNKLAVIEGGQQDSPSQIIDYRELWTPKTKLPPPLKISSPQVRLPTTMSEERKKI
jgi:hypothetical protein